MKGNLKKHSKLHTREKRYSCDQCEEAFTSSAELRRHQRVHFGDKVYRCDKCEKGFTQSATSKFIYALTLEKNHTSVPSVKELMPKNVA